MSEPSQKAMEVALLIAADEWEDERLCDVFRAGEPSRSCLRTTCHRHCEGLAITIARAIDAAIQAERARCAAIIYPEHERMTPEELAYVRHCRKEMLELFNE